MKRRLVQLTTGVVVLLGLAIGLVWGRSPSAVDWTRVRGVCVESDDWGLCGFVPDSTAARSLDREALDPGGFPDVYWYSTLEDSAMVAALSDVLVRHRGRDGLPAVLQPNYILASLGFHPQETDSAARWSVHELPDTPPGYARPGLWTAVRQARVAGVWQPELHGLLHYDPQSRKERTDGAPLVERAAADQVLVFPGSERAWELGEWRDAATVVRELDRSLVLFENLFGCRPQSMIAPDYVWNDAHERLWCDRGLRIIQAKREQRRAVWRGRTGRVLKVLDRTWSRWRREDRVYLERNCIFEPVQHRDPRGITHQAIAAVSEAWSRGEPAVVEAHRINFVHLDAAVCDLGRREFDDLLGAVDGNGPLYLVDAEVAALQRRGTAWGLRGDRIVVRNAARARRLVVIPAEAFAVAGELRGEAPDDAKTVVVSVAAGETRVLSPAELSRPEFVRD